MAWEKVSQVRAAINRDMRPLEEAETEANALLELAPDGPYGHVLLGYIGHERGDRNLRKSPGPGGGVQEEGELAREIPAPQRAVRSSTIDLTLIRRAL